MRVQYYLQWSGTPGPGVTADPDPQTLIQIAAAANHRIVVPRIDIGFRHNDPAVTPFRLQMVTQSTVGTNGTAITAQKADRGYDETIQGSFWEYQTVAGATEPTLGAILTTLSLHQQGTLPWIPPFPWVVKGGERVGLRLLDHGGTTNTVAVAFTVYCEE